MNTNQLPITRTHIHIIWLIMSFSNLMFFGVIFFLHAAGIMEPIAIDVTQYLLVAAIIGTIAAVFFSKRVKHANLEYLHAARTLTGNEEQLLTQYFQKLITGMSLANLPGTLGIVVMILSADFLKALILLAVSLVLCLMLKPDFSRV